MPSNPARLDHLIARTEEVIAEQTRRLKASPADSPEAKAAQRAVVGLYLDLIAFRQSRDAIAEARRLTGPLEP